MSNESYCEGCIYEYDSDQFYCEPCRACVTRDKEGRAPRFLVCRMNEYKKEVGSYAEDF